jgi:shikimate kinase / 3-dehydroquinate synthase
MGTGKTAVGRPVAERLGLRFVDTDVLIEERQGKTIPELFRVHGEAHFRGLERELCRELSGERGLVIATGGGMPVDPDNRKILNAAGTVIRLWCSPSEILTRVGAGEHRPLLNASDPLDRVSQLLREREPAYAALPFQVNTAASDIDGVVERVLEIAAAASRLRKTLSVSVPRSGGYPVCIGDGVLSLLGETLRDRGLTARLAVVTDTNVGPLFLGNVLSSLSAAGFVPFACEIPAGEQSKTLAQLQYLYECFLTGGLDRRGAVTALGGGVVGDLAGYAAATYMRGVAFVQCPTTLLAMVDSSVGGKTGVDLPQGKNLVGAIKQPMLVLADTSTLAGLPDAQVRMGMAELIKHTVIGDPELFRELEQSEGQLSLTADLISRSASVKIRVVEEDPYESGRREVLNLGHTVGHALEKCSRYSMGHGDAVAVGMVAAGRISQRMGLCSSDLVDSLEAVLARTGLMIRHAYNSEDLAAVMAADKKTVGGRVRFVLIRDLGLVEPGWEVNPHLVRAVLEELREPH